MAEEKVKKAVAAKKKEELEARRKQEEEACRQKALQLVRWQVEEHQEGVAPSVLVASWFLNLASVVGRISQWLLMILLWVI